MEEVTSVNDNQNNPTFADAIINNITQQIENVVNEKWQENKSPKQQHTPHSTQLPPTVTTRGENEKRAGNRIEVEKGSNGSNGSSRPHSAPQAFTSKLSPTHTTTRIHVDPRIGPRTKVLNMEEWTEVYQRLKSFNDEKNERIKQKTEEKQKAEMLEVKTKPTISKTSEKMVRNHEDLIQRMTARKAESDKKLNQLRKQKEESVMSKVQPSPTINPQSQKLHRPKGVMELWTLERNKRLKALQDKQREAEEDSLKNFFRPKINSKSEQLLEKRRDSHEDVAVRLSVEHQKKLHKLDGMRKQFEPSYQPTINDRSRAIKLTSPVHERLYHVGMEHIVSKHKLMADNWDFCYNLKKPLHLDAEPNPPVNISVDEDSELVASGESKVERNYGIGADYDQYEYDNEYTYFGNNAMDPGGEYYRLYTEPTEQLPDEHLPVEQNDHEHSATNNNVSGYDEELRLMMIEAGFFKSQHAQSTLNGEQQYFVE